MGLLSAIFGGKKETTTVTAGTSNDISVTPTTNLNNNISTVVDFTQAGQLLAGSLDGFNEQVGSAGGAIGDGLAKLTKTAVAIGLIVVIGSTLRE